MSSEDEEWPVHQASKRRRLNPVAGCSSDEDEHSSVERSERSERSSESPEQRGRNEKAGERQKPRHRIHIVKNPTLADETFFTQAPTPSQNPHVIRGAYWQSARFQYEAGATSWSTRISTSNVNFESPPELSNSAHETEELPSREEHMTNVTAEQGPFARSSNSDEDEAALLLELADVSADEFESDHKLAPEAVGLLENLTHGEASQVQNGIVDAIPTTAPRNNLRQMTLFGTQMPSNRNMLQSAASNRAHDQPARKADEPPTHHKLDHEALKTWTYPTNLGAIRDYQYSIVSRGLYTNLLVALPTGLGKTFIAATIMLNWFRWTEDSQIVFVAPTKPLVSQQVHACFQVAGIPRSSTTLLTGETPPGLRAEEWQTKRVFFMTPQTIVNDLKTGICDPKRIVLVVVDEAHRATGNYAYVEVIKFLRRFNNSFRVLALTATPGSKIESVQEVIDGLGIAKTEIRTEESIDIRQYVHQRNIDSMLFDYSEQTERIMELLSNAIRPVLNILNSQNAYWSKDPMSLTAFGCTTARAKWMSDPAGRAASFGLRGMVNSIFNTLASIGHAIELLKFHGIGPFYNKAVAFRDEDNDEGKKGSKYKNQIVNHADFKKMMGTIKTWMANPDFLGHPKLEYLSQVVLNHFIDAGEGRSAAAEASPVATRIMIFAHYRDSAEEIVRVLERHKPMVRAHVFVGQAASRASEGMDQKKQLDIIDRFKKGSFNTLVATSIGEEGLDIGEVDLIICYDASASPIRMLQRMGRTGRKRAGNIVVLLMKKKEKDNFEKAKDNYEKMQQLIAEGTHFLYHDDLSPRIVPREMHPVVDKRIVEIPIENSQTDLPEPKKRKGRPPKKPPKKFNMPDGVVTGFMSASHLGKEIGTRKGYKKARVAQSPTPEPLPPLNDVLLTELQDADLVKRFLDIGENEPETVEHPRLDKFPFLQREDRPTKLIGHGAASWRLIRLLGDMRDVNDGMVRALEHNLDPEDQHEADVAAVGRARVLSPDLYPLPVADDLSRTCALRKRKQTLANPRAGKRSRSRKKALRPQSTDPLEAGTDIVDTDHEESGDEGDDLGSDLFDFIDDATPQPMSSSMTSSSPVMTNKANSPAAGSEGGSEDGRELPDVDDILGVAEAANQPVFKQQKRGRMMVDDSEDE